MKERPILVEKHGPEFVVWRELDDAHTRCRETGTKFPKAVDTHTPKAFGVVVDVVVVWSWATQHQMIREGIGHDASENEDTFITAWGETWCEREGLKDQKNKSVVVPQKREWRSLGALKEECIEVSWSGLNQRG